MTKEDYQKAYVETPRLGKYPREIDDGHQCIWHVAYCNNVEDLERCNLCGKEVVTPCSFDDDYA